MYAAEMWSIVLNSPISVDCNVDFIFEGKQDDDSGIFSTGKSCGIRSSSRIWLLGACKVSEAPNIRIKN